MRKPNTGSKICPHVCECGSACYRGFYEVECVNPMCDHYVEKTLIAFQREYLKTERTKANDLLDIEDAPTQPNAKTFDAFESDDRFAEYLDSWGLLLGVPKQAGEPVNDYRRRLLKILQNVGEQADAARMVPVVTSIEPEACLKSDDLVVVGFENEPGIDQIGNVVYRKRRIFGRR